MTQATRSVLDAARSLTEAERAELLQELLSAFHDDETSESPDEVERAWVAEAERRVQAMDDGSSPELPGEEIMEAMRRGERP